MQAIWKRIVLSTSTKVIPTEKYFSWLPFGNDPRVQEKEQLKEHESYISVSVVYLKFPSTSWEYQSRHEKSILRKTVWYIYRDKEQDQEKKVS